MKTTLLVPTLNEEVGMREVMPKVRREWFDQILILDGQSTDRTVELAHEQGFEVHIQTKRGLRQGYNEVVPLIRGDVVLTFSPDGNCIPELMPQLLAKMAEGYDMVVCSRYAGSAKSEDDDIITGFGNWLFTTTVNVLHGGHYTDAMGIYRAFRTSLIRDLELMDDRGFALAEKLFRTRISWEPLLSVRAAKCDLRITEIPGDEPARVGGVRKLQIMRWGAAYLFQFVREIFCWRRSRLVGPVHPASATVAAQRPVVPSPEPAQK